MKYTKRYKTKRGQTRFMFMPPEDARKAGVVKSKVFQDGRTARFEIPKLIQRVEDYRKGLLVVDNIGPSSKLQDIISHYQDSVGFNSLSLSTQRNYSTALNCIQTTSIGAKHFGQFKLDKINTKLCNQVYQIWVKERGVYSANRYKTIYSVLMKYCWSLDLLDFNPMSKVKSLNHKPESYVWTKEQVEKVLDECFKDFEYRNLGILILLCYEWVQRPKDIRYLKWSNIDFETNRVTITQSKRGATVTLPLDEPIRSLLLEQKEDWDFQEYVVPHHRTSDNAYRPMSGVVMATKFNKIKERVGLPDELEVGHLRKTAINEMVEASIDSTSIMQVSGHRNIQSLNPYIKHTYEGAKSALTARRKFKDV